MENVKKKLLIGIGVTLFSFLIGYLVKGAANEGTYYDVGWSSWDITANVLDNGDMEVSEKLVYFDDTFSNNHVSESLISFSKSTRSNIDDKDTSSLKEGSFYVSVYDEDETYFINQNTPSSNAYDFTKTDDCLGFSWVEGCRDERGMKISSNGDYQKVFIYLEDGLKTGLTIEFKYTVENVITKYSDYSVLNWKFAGAYDYADNRNVNLTINLPSGGEVLNSSITNEGFSHDGMTIMGFGTTNAKLTTQTGSKVEAKAKRLFDEFNDNMEIFISIPNDKVDLFPNIVDGDTNYTLSTGYNQLNQIIVDALEDEDSFYKSYVIIEIIVCLVAVAWILLTIYTMHKSYINFDKELKSNFEYEYLREIPSSEYSPSVASFLVNEQKLDVNSLNSELMDLIRRGYITIDINGQDLTDKNANMIMVLNQDKYQGSNDLTNSEKYLLNWFFVEIGKDGRLSFKELDDYMDNHINAEKYNKSNNQWNVYVKDRANKKNWFDNVSRAQNKMWVGFLGFVLVFILFMNIVNYNLTWIPLLFVSLLLGCGVSLCLYLPTIKRKTQEGIDEYTKWMAFKKFLEEFSTFEDYPVPSLIVWEHYMVYATMFGIADLVEKQLKTKFREMNRTQEYDAYPYFRYRYYYHVHYRVNNARNIGMQAIAREKARQGGSGGRSGGFGGGSSFGGGGRGGSFR